MHFRRVIQGGDPCTVFIVSGLLYGMRAPGTCIHLFSPRMVEIPNPLLPSDWDVLKTNVHCVIPHATDALQERVAEDQWHSLCVEM